MIYFEIFIDVMFKKCVKELDLRKEEEYRVVGLCVFEEKICERGGLVLFVVSECYKRGVIWVFESFISRVGI